MKFKFTSIGNQEYMEIYCENCGSSIEHIPINFTSILDDKSNQEWIRRNKFHYDESQLSLIYNYDKEEYFAYLDEIVSKFNRKNIICSCEFRETTYCENNIIEKYHIYLK